jgi:hypothetical protein
MVGGWDQKDWSSRPTWANSLWDPISNITRVKWTEGVAQEIECLLCKDKTLNSNVSPTKKRKNFSKCTHSPTSSWASGHLPSFLMHLHCLRGHKSLKEAIPVVVFLDFQAERLPEKRREAWRPGTRLWVHQRQSEWDVYVMFSTLTRSIHPLAKLYQNAPQHQAPVQANASHSIETLKKQN